MVILLGLSVNIKDETKYGLQYDEFIEIQKKGKKSTEEKEREGDRDRDQEIF